MKVKILQLKKSDNKSKVRFNVPFDVDDDSDSGYDA